MQSSRIAAAALPDAPPFVGALLRLCWQRARARIRDAVREAGFTDLQEAQLLVFSWPPPDAVRPSELARRLNMSRQAANHVIQQMEALGYLERRAPDGSDRRLVFLTPRGRAVCEVIIGCMRALQAEWAEQLGPGRFAEFVDVLRQLAAEPAS